MAVPLAEVVFQVVLLALLTVRREKILSVRIACTESCSSCIVVFRLVSAVIFSVFAACLAWSCLIGTALTSISWSTTDFQSNAEFERRPEIWMPAICAGGGRNEPYPLSVSSRRSLAE